MFKSGYIAILGAPNAGKSTLLNAILKEKIAAVTDKPQTTRKRLKGIHTTDACQMIFLDTPGVHRSQKSLNRFMQGEIDEAVRSADILVYLFAVDDPETGVMLDLIRRVGNSPPPPLKLRGGEGGVMSQSPKKAIVVVNKIDLPLEQHRLDVEGLKRETGTFGATGASGLKGYPLSALDGTGLDDLISAITDMLPEGPSLYPEENLTDENLRDIASEIIREKAMAFLREEIPYSLAVEVNEFKEPKEPPPPLRGGGEGEGGSRQAASSGGTGNHQVASSGGSGLTHIRADIVVEHESQKGMVIGGGGRMIKQIGTRARKDIETLLGAKVFLELKVKVDKNWTKNPARLARYGYKR